MLQGRNTPQSYEYRPGDDRRGGVGQGGRPKYGLHAFRHFFASWCINPKDRGGRALSAKEVQTLLGHETIQITMDIYGHLFPRGDDQAELDASTKRLLG